MARNTYTLLLMPFMTRSTDMPTSTAASFSAELNLEKSVRPEKSAAILESACCTLCPVEGFPTEECPTPLDGWREWQKQAASWNFWNSERGLRRDDAMNWYSQYVVWYNEHQSGSKNSPSTNSCCMSSAVSTAAISLHQWRLNSTALASSLCQTKSVRGGGGSFR